MKVKNRILAVSVFLSFLFPLTLSLCLAVDSSNDFTMARTAIRGAMALLQAKKDDAGILVLTNAYYGQINGQSTEQYRDIVSETTGCTSGKRSLLDVHTPFSEPLWFSLFQRETHRLVFCRWQDGSFQRQTLDAAPEQLLEVDTWKTASNSPIGPHTLFQVVSINLGWSAGTDWSNLKAAGFHGELPPGVNIGYLFHQYLQKHMPLEKAYEWRFFGALPKCYMDTLQVVYNTTLGKMQAYGLSMSKEQLGKYKIKGAMPCIVALQVNKAKDTCRGMVLGFSRKQVMDDLGVREADLNSTGGASNPVFCIARIKACIQMARMKPEEQMRWIVEMHRFSGTASLVDRVCNAGGDPYAIVWAR